MKIRMNGEHQGVADRFEQLEERAFVYPFLIERVGGKQLDISSVLKGYALR